MWILPSGSWVGTTVWLKKNPCYQHALMIRVISLAWKAISLFLLVRQASLSLTFSEYSKN